MLNNACLKAAGDRSEILDCEVLRLSYEKSVQKIDEINPRIACFVVYGQQPSASSQNMEGAVETSKLLKKLCPEIKILFIGGHVAALPYETLNEEESIDIVACNEGVIAVLNILSLEKIKDENLKKLKEYFLEIKKE